MGRQKHLEPAALGETWDVPPPRSAVRIETIFDEERLMIFLNWRFPLNVDIDTPIW